MGTAILVISILAAVFGLALLLSALVIFNELIDLWSSHSPPVFAEGIFIFSLIAEILLLPTLIILSIINAFS